MSEHIISGLKRKRSELAGELQSIKADLAAIDRALAVFGFHETESLKPRMRQRRPSLFSAGELTALVGKAERAGCEDNASIADWIMTEKGLEPQLYNRVRASVKDKRKPSAI